MKHVSKICKSCNQEKVTDEFPLRGNHRLNTCSLCYNEQQNILWKKRYETDPEFRRCQIEKIRRAQWKSRYNTTPEIVYATLDEQGNRCANETCRKLITLDPFEKEIEKAHIDHDHKSKNFRSLLCCSCNTFLGRVEKNPEQIFGLLEYLKLFTQNKDN